MNLQVPTSERDHVRGAASAPVTLVEYADFECPFSARAYPVVKRLLERFGSDVQLVFRHKPLAKLHPHAELAARAAEAAGMQGKFWPMHDMLFEHRDRLSDAAVRRFASELGLNREKFISDLRSPEVERRVRADELGAAQSHVHGTPSFFVDGVPFQENVSAEALGEAIEHSLEHRRAQGARLVSSVSGPVRPRATSAPGETTSEQDDPEDEATPRRPRIRRRDTPGHIDPHYRAMLLRESGHSRDPDDALAFISGTRSSDALAEQLGEEFVESATRGQDEGDDLFNQEVPEEEGGPFVESNAGTEFAPGTDASNIPGATREPFPKT